ncbi:PBP1A family penicillin-binding protein [Patescibacteria group bacterium]|nr:PBP1A family penicillin-binding protein [Patescibacteria group bacterium]MBU1931545.1 PBP1A family penicillin-binding protein [Patescibacteria group bacterium]
MISRTVENFGLALEIIGRFTYQTVFFLFKVLIYLIKAPLHLIKVIRLPSFKSLQLPRLSIRFTWSGKLKKRLLVLLLLVTLTAGFYFYVLDGLPNPKTLVTQEQILTTKIYDRHGQLLYRIYHDENRTLVQLSELPAYFIQATLAAEDADFYQHNGFSLKGIFRSLKNLLLKQSVQGGSTITQQLVKNALLSSEQTMQRKLKELVLSIMTEYYFNKDEILQMYFNEIPYGGMAYGAEEAAQTYFGKSITQINLSEAALLAGLPAAPTIFSPSGAHPELTKDRQRFVLNRMVEENYLDQATAKQAEKTTLEFVPLKNQIQAPHFVMYIKNLLAKKYGIKTVEQGGLQVITSLDLKLQQQAETIIQQELAKVTHYQIGNGAVLITNPQTGEILAMVGSKDYFDVANDGNVNVTLRPRQAGSAIKPINYAVALANGYTPATILADTPITYNYPGSPPYSPQNYDGRFHGAISLRSALANSYNVPAVKVLYSYGVDKMISQGQKMGITTWTQPERYGLSLTLGGAEVKMVDLAVAYGSLANLGFKVDLHPIIEVKNAKGKTMEKPFFALENTKVLSPQIAYILTDILADNAARTPAFGANSDLYIPDHQVAVKTGTTNNKRDNWTIGYTSDYLVSVWVGNNDNTSMSEVASGITGASPIWNRTMNLLLTNKIPHRFIEPKNLIPVEICQLNGLLPCAGCPTKTELFISGTEPTTHCTAEQIQMAQAQNNQVQRDQILEGVSHTN